MNLSRLTLHHCSKLTIYFIAATVKTDVLEENSSRGSSVFSLHQDSMLANSRTWLPPGHSIRRGVDGVNTGPNAKSQTFAEHDFTHSSPSLLAKFLTEGFKNSDDWASAFSLSVMEARGRLRQEVRSPIRHSCNNILPFLDKRYSEW